MSSGKRIAKNTLMLYFRMLLLMAISLYTSRIVLRELGVEDFGTYNIVGGIVMMFSFLNTSMAGTTQRFINVERGKGDDVSATQFFSMGINCQIIIIAVFLLLAETIGLWYLYNYVNIPSERFDIAIKVYHISVLTSCFTIFFAPYNGAIIAYEKMDIFAYMGILEAIMKLGIVYLLSLSEFDHLLLYALLTLLVTISIASLYVVICIKKIPICKYHFFWESDKFKSLMGYSVWSLLGNFANLGITYGLNLVQNFFFNVKINAAMGVATQVNGAVTRFLGGFSTAYEPQETNLIAQNNIVSATSLIYSASKLSYYLMLLLGLPIIICGEEILSLWLTEVPDYSVPFCALMIIYTMVDATSVSLATAVSAIGDIRNYQLMLSLFKLLVIPLSVIGLIAGASPEYVLLVNIAMNVVTYIYRLFYVKKRMTFSITLFIKNVIIPCIIVTCSSAPIVFFIHHMLICNTDNTVIKLFVTLFFTVVTCLISVFYLGTNSQEKALLKQFLASKYNHK